MMKTNICLILKDLDALQILDKCLSLIGRAGSLAGSCAQLTITREDDIRTEQNWCPFLVVCTFGTEARTNNSSCAKSP